jgi:Holliday junction DNA helicase RuvA
MLSSLNPGQVVEAIEDEDVATIKSVKGIGAKTAQRVIIDLKDKIELAENVNKNIKPSRNTQRNEALSALETLGYSRKQSIKIVEKVISNHPQATVEMIIKNALKNL